MLKRKYEICYATWIEVEATSAYEAERIVEEKLGEENVSFDERDIGTWEMGQYYEVTITTGPTKVFAEYHRDTSIREAGGHGPRSGHYWYRDDEPGKKGHILYIPSNYQTDAFSDKDYKMINEQIAKIEDARDQTSAVETPPDPIH